MGIEKSNATLKIDHSQSTILSLPRVGEVWRGRHIPDPMLQYSSPYVGMGNRPSSMIDPDGMWAFGETRRYRNYFDEWAAYKECSDRQMEWNSFVASNSGINIDLEHVKFVLFIAELTGGSGSIGSTHFDDKDTEDIVREAALNDVEFALKLYKLSQSEVDYLFRWTGEIDFDNDIYIQEGFIPGKFITDEKSGNPIIEFSTYKGSDTWGPLSNLYHETEHGIQFENGRLGFIKGEDGIWGPNNHMYDINDEIDANIAAFSAPGVNQIKRNRFLKKSPGEQANFLLQSKNYDYIRIFSNHGMNHVPIIQEWQTNKRLIHTEKYLHFEFY